MIEVSVPGIYISYPFCSQKCTYCNFASGVHPRAKESAYLGTLQQEIREADIPWTPETVYLGGGTPSSMDTDDLACLLAAIPGHPWREATLEAAPGTITPERARAWKQGGINRVSLGVQSFVPEELRRTGRTHTAELVAQEVEILRDAGLPNINIDLIAGLPHQTLDSWRSSLDWLERLAPPHASIYMLEIDEDSRLGAEILLNGQRYGAPATPPDETTAAMYEEAVARLGTSGLERYEISNFARPAFASLHNLKYWKLEPYLGFGADAHSFDGRCRWANPDAVDSYLTSRTRETEPALPEERFFVGLRLMNGIRPAPAEWERYREPIGRFLEQGLLQSHAGALRLTSRGVLFSNEIFQEFLPA